MTPYRTVLDDGSTTKHTTEPHPDLGPHPRLPVSSRSTLILSKLGSSLRYFSIRIFEVIFSFIFLGCAECTWLSSWRQRRLERKAATCLRLSLGVRENEASLRVFYKVPVNSRLHSVDIWYSMPAKMTVVMSKSQRPVYSLPHFIFQGILLTFESINFIFFRELCCDICLIFFLRLLWFRITASLRPRRLVGFLGQYCHTSRVSCVHSTSRVSCVHVHHVSPMYTYITCLLCTQYTVQSNTTRRDKASLKGKEFWVHDFKFSAV